MTSSHNSLVFLQHIYHISFGLYKVVRCNDIMSRGHFGSDLQPHNTEYNSNLFRSRNPEMFGSVFWDLMITVRYSVRRNIRGWEDLHITAHIHTNMLITPSSTHSLVLTQHTYYALTYSCIASQRVQYDPVFSGEHHRHHDLPYEKYVYSSVLLVYFFYTKNRKVYFLCTSQKYT